MSKLSSWNKYQLRVVRMEDRHWQVVSQTKRPMESPPYRDPGDAQLQDFMFQELLTAQEAGEREFGLSAVDLPAELFDEHTRSLQRCTSRSPWRVEAHEDHSGWLFTRE